MGINPQIYKEPNISRMAQNLSTKFGTLNKHYKAYHSVKKSLQSVQK